MQLSIIVAVSDDMAIGKDNDLLWHLPKDLAYFKAVTEGHAILMGRRTYLSLPHGALPRRTNLVLSSTLGNIDPAVVVRSIDQAIELSEQAGETELFVIGGGKLYTQTIALADRLYVTHVHTTAPEADTFFPPIDPKIWQVVSEETWEADERNVHRCTHRTYERICQ